MQMNRAGQVNSIV